MRASALLGASAAAFLFAPCLASPGSSAGPANSPQGDRLGTVSFHVSCSSSVQPSFNRGVALLHDFWYEEAKPQFERILSRDPGCAMARWGIAMSVFHQIWDRPDDAATATGWRELQAAEAHQRSVRDDGPLLTAA